MGIRGIKNRILLQFWILFFVSMFFIYVLVMFLFLERTTAHFVEQKRNSLKLAIELTRQAGDADDAFRTIANSMVFPPN